MRFIKSAPLLILLFFSSAIYAQFGIKGGMNMANEIKSFSQADIAAGYNSNNLQGYQIGLVYQLMPKKSGLGIEIAALISQKGSTFKLDSTDVINVFKQGYREVNYLEVPFNLRYRLSLGFLGIYGFGGVYGGYAMSAKTVNETTDITSEETLQSFMDRADYGYNFGAGIELFRKIQFGGTFSQGIKNTTISNSILPPTTSATNRVMTINLVYMF
ncbi:MAG: outer membrane beta-barrel protein [Paludibacter sp.]